MLRRRARRLAWAYSLAVLGDSLCAQAQIPPLRGAEPAVWPAPHPAPLVGKDPRKIRTGALIWAAGYLPAFVAPLVLWPGADTSTGQSSLALFSLLIPVAGPVVSAVAAPAQAETKTAVISSWSVPWLLTSGLVQAAGFALFVRGLLPNYRPDDSIVFLPQANGLAAAGRF